MGFNRACIPGMRLAAALAAVAITCAARAAAGDPVVEERTRVQVHAPDAQGPQFAQSIVVSIVREPVAGRRPMLILLHGRPIDAATRARLALPIYPANARYFARHGFVVLIPLRVGYGISGGPDVEYTGECASKRFAEGARAAVAETRQVIAFAASLPYVDAARGVLVGESFGGLVAIAAAAAGVPGILAAVNISGGDGGDPVLRPDEPCRPDQLREAFAAYGRSGRLPTLWLYSANDRLWGTKYPGEWYRAYVGAGGVGRFESLPADKNNGHFIFNRNAAAWHPAVEGFLAEAAAAEPSR